MKPETSDGMRIYRRLLGYVLPHWHAFIITIVSLVVVALSEVAFAAYIKPLIDGSFVEKDPDVIKYAPLIMVAIFIFRGIATYLSRYWMAWVARKVINVLRGEMFSQLIHLPVSWFDMMPSGTLLSKLVYDVEQVARASTDAISILVRDTLTVIALIAWMFYLNWSLAVILMIGTPFIAQVINSVNRRFRRYSTRIQNSVRFPAAVATERRFGY